ncbi:MAG: 3-keto-disaccharide hydrolase [Planctomycetota bacterium]
MRNLRGVAAGLLAVFVAVAAVQLEAAEQEKSKWKPLMDGKTLQGWHPVGDGKWTVEDGVFVGRANNEKLYGLLVSDKTFKDFAVRLKFKVLSGDSGFYIRTIIKPPEKANGLQVQVGLPGSGVGGIYESYGRAWLVKPEVEAEKKYTKTDDWNEMIIIAKGGHVVVQVNGVETAELKEDPSRPEGHFALQMHSGNVMHVMFKEIAILQE